MEWSTERSDVKRATVPVVSVPTTLSGGEYQALAGGTNDATHQKHGFRHGTVGPSLVVLDAELTTTTPDRFWLSTGIRAVDHCVETLCSLRSRKESDMAAVKGLKQLVPGLLRCKMDRGDLDARHLCQLGVIDAMAAVRTGVDLGASHGIGHQLGPLGVGHGETSCILLPSVCKYNSKVNKSRQELVANVLWADTDVTALLEARGLEKSKTDLGDILDAVISELGMPRSLKAVGIGRDKLELLAANSLNDKWCHTNPIPLEEKSQVLEILETVVL
jgi:alcohol dehydrogenase class IV